MREARYVSLIPRKTLHSDSEHIYFNSSQIHFWICKCTYILVRILQNLQGMISSTDLLLNLHLYFILHSPWWIFCLVVISYISPSGFFAAILLCLSDSLLYLLVILCGVAQLLALWTVDVQSWVQFSPVDC